MLFEIESLNIKIEVEEKELVKDFNELLDDIAPEGKTGKSFNGGYIQQLKNSNQLVAFFGNDKNNNIITEKVRIDAAELDWFYMMLKAKIIDMKNNTAKVKSISMAQRKIDKAKKNNKHSHLVDDSDLSND